MQSFISNAQPIKIVRPVIQTNEKEQTFYIEYLTIIGWRITQTENAGCFYEPIFFGNHEIEDLEHDEIEASEIIYENIETQDWWVGTGESGSGATSLIEYIKSRIDCDWQLIWCRYE
jgi:hypothetical protein